MRALHHILRVAAVMGALQCPAPPVANAVLPQVVLWPVLWAGSVAGSVDMRYG